MFPFKAKNPEEMTINTYEDIFEVCTSPAFTEETYTRTYAPLLSRKVFVPDTASEDLVNKNINKESVDKTILDLLKQLRNELLEQYLFLTTNPKVIERFVFVFLLVFCLLIQAWYHARRIFRSGENMFEVFKNSVEIQNVDYYDRFHLAQKMTDASGSSTQLSESVSAALLSKFDFLHFYVY